MPYHQNLWLKIYVEKNIDPLRWKGLKVRHLKLYGHLDIIFESVRLGFGQLHFFIKKHHKMLYNMSPAQSRYLNKSAYDELYKQTLKRRVLETVTAKLIFDNETKISVDNFCDRDCQMGFEPILFNKHAFSWLSLFLQ